ncbi:hypothetical protein [Ruegeria aquimaris]|uniref:Dihydroorotate dehydrogenase n=1 Tax=Ruegeria aquimaris TaxID=2984333 RepID=A0ABT3ANE6_9RHOB|nr:hypothetical protein [Ruegeria sp. XHP0148]MCV2890211.1 hypothetical protein [Ruegeria sp. XHP0148]
MTRLDDMLAAARHARRDVPDDLVGRILADADRIQANRIAVPRGEERQKEPGLWQQLLIGFGGWPGVGGMVAAGVTGVWIGVFPPENLPDPSDLVFQTSGDSEFLNYYGLVDVLGEEG